MLFPDIFSEPLPESPDERVVLIGMEFFEAPFIGIEMLEPGLKISNVGVTSHPGDRHLFMIDPLIVVMHPLVGLPEEGVIGQRLLRRLEEKIGKEILPVDIGRTGDEGGQGIEFQKDGGVGPEFVEIAVGGVEFVEVVRFAESLFVLGAGEGDYVEIVVPRLEEKRRLDLAQNMEHSSQIRPAERDEARLEGDVDVIGEVAEDVDSVDRS